MSSRFKRRFKKTILFLLIFCVASVAGYVAYVFMTYHRLPDAAEQHSNRTTNPASVGETYTAVTWNLGFGAYNRDFSFFMDGGKESRARSLQDVYDNMVHCVDLVNNQDVDFALFQEVDRKADRSWHVDEAEIIRQVLVDYQTYYVQNYDSAYLLYPLDNPHGASKSGLITFSNRDIYRAERRTLPVETGWRKILDLDRCYSICHIPTDDGRNLCLFNLHLSAYTADGTIATEQLEILLQNMKEEYDSGNYVIAAGDFNKDLLGNSGEIFGVSGENYAWAQPIDLSLLPEGLQLISSLDEDHPVPSCRNCDTGYIPGQTFVVTVDGFIASDNVEVLDCHVIDDDFQCTDHNPVILKFRLRGDASPAQAGDGSSEAEALTDIEE